MYSLTGFNKFYPDQNETQYLVDLMIEYFYLYERIRLDTSSITYRFITPRTGMRYGFEITDTSEGRYLRLRMYVTEFSEVGDIHPYRLENKQGLSGTEGNVWVSISVLSNVTFPLLNKFSYQGMLGFPETSYSTSDDVGTMNVTIRRSGGSNGEAKAMVVTADGTAIQGEDYVSTTQTIVWADGEEGDKLVPINIIADTNTGEVDEDFTLSITKIWGGCVAGDTVADITIVSSQPIGPASLAIIIDNSQSLTSSELTSERSAASSAINALDYDDEVALYTLNGSVTQIQDFTDDKTTALTSLATVTSLIYGTVVMDALYQAATDLTGRGNRRAILIMTDGQGDGTHTQAEVIAYCQANDISIYALGFSDGINTTSLSALATQTDGIFIASPTAAELTTFIGELMDAIT